MTLNGQKAYAITGNQKIFPTGRNGRLIVSSSGLFVAVRLECRSSSTFRAVTANMQILTDRWFETHSRTRTITDIYVSIRMAEPWGDCRSENWFQSCRHLHQMDSTVLQRPTEVNRFQESHNKCFIVSLSFITLQVKQISKKVSKFIRLHVTNACLHAELSLQTMNTTAKFATTWTWYI